jgi:hypothetical protein
MSLLAQGNFSVVTGSDSTLVPTALVASTV